MNKLGLERTIYGWVLAREDEATWREWCKLKAEAKADAASVPIAEDAYLAASLYESTKQLLGLDDAHDPMLLYEVARVAFEGADFGEIARWVLRNDEDWPQPEGWEG